VVQLHDFDFDLPSELIAQEPAAQRDQSRLMVVDRAAQQITHDVFANIGNYLRTDDVLVINDTKVIPARLRGRKVGSGGRVEALLLHEIETGVWEVLLKPATKVRPGTVVEFGEGELRGEVQERLPGAILRLRFTPSQVYDVLDRCGEVPLPPYIKRSGEHSQDVERYQTVYACHPGAVAAPTAGLHFTPELLAALAHQGIHHAAVTLHVGWGTFQPIRTACIEQHRMAKEFYRLEAEQAAIIQRAHTHGGRVVAIGTTATRTIETVVQRRGRLVADSGWTDLFIYPPYAFRIVNLLLTNFHVPRSTLFLLVCAFAGRETMLEAYHRAMAERYRFYSYGDAMLIR
jgi:S-adenosylmethionine:tRNA ribosyltransferase-isomerase